MNKLNNKTNHFLVSTNSGSLIFLFFAAAVMLITMLASREIWTQEHRWADIVSGMFYRQDFLHPYLGANDYYDKPLFSYWIIAAISYVIGHLNLWALRLPSAFAGLLAVWSIYRLGTQLRNKDFGILCGWMLITTFFFIFWARTSSADMLNMAGSLFAVAWYFDKKHNPTFYDYLVFFCILALTALCKGLVGPVVSILAILPNIIQERSYQKYLRLNVILAMIPAAIIYILPFWASSHFGGNKYEESGLYLVYKENILRYFQPFDHKDPIYTYFLFLPIYLLPWSVFFIPALCTLKKRWKDLNANSKWIVGALFVLFVFFTLSGSRRNYYVLPMLPFALLLTADWIASAPQWIAVSVRKCIIFFFTVFFIYFCVFQPLYYFDGGQKAFANTLKSELSNLEKRDFVLLDAESKVRFYMNLPPDIKTLDIPGKLRKHQTTQTLLETWPILKDNKDQAIIITRKQYEHLLLPIMNNYRVVETPLSAVERIFGLSNANASVAFIPLKT